MRKRLLGLMVLCGVISGCNNEKSSDVDASTDPATAACELNWKVANVAPCIAAPTLETPPLIYSSHLNDQGVAECEAYDGFPQPLPADPWSAQYVIAETTGDARLCIALKHGSAEKPTGADCALFEQCADVSYTTPGKRLDLAPLMAWSATDDACSRQYYQNGGYLELRVESDSLGCAEDGEQVSRFQFCPLDCGKGDTRDKCKNCTDTAALTGAF